MSDEVLAVWNDVKAALVVLEEDVVKNLVMGNASAGVRARKGIRDVRKKLAALVKQSLEVTKAKKSTKEKA